MRVGFLMLVVLAGAAMGVACTQQKATAPPPLIVPSTAIANHPKPLQPYHLLPRDGDDVYIARGEKVAYGSFPLFGVSTYSLYTYDAQQIGDRWGYGVRYRYLVQQGESASLPP